MPTLGECGMHRLASVHLQSCSHHFSRESVTIVTADKTVATRFGFSLRARPRMPPLHFTLTAHLLAPTARVPFPPPALRCCASDYSTSAGLVCEDRRIVREWRDARLRRARADPVMTVPLANNCPGSGGCAASTLLNPVLELRTAAPRNCLPEPAPARAVLEFRGRASQCLRIVRELPDAQLRRGGCPPDSRIPNA